jgi:hypothetical protein
MGSKEVTFVDLVAAVHDAPPLINAWGREQARHANRLAGSLATACFRSLFHEVASCFRVGLSDRSCIERAIPPLKGLISPET